MSNPSYGDAIWVVLMISTSKLILMSFGCGPAILATAKFYKITLPFSILMAIAVYFLNDIYIIFLCLYLKHHHHKLGKSFLLFQKIFSI